MGATIHHDSDSITCRCESCVTQQLDAEGPGRTYADGTLHRFDQSYMDPDSALYLSNLRDKYRKQTHRR